MKFTLPNNIELDDGALLAPGLQSYARGKGFDDARAFVATHPDGYQTYLLVVGTEPEFESQLYEAVAVHIDMMAADRDMPR